MSNWNQKNVFLLEDTPLDQFKCETHENFICKIAAIKISYHNDFCSKHSCDNSLSYYWVRKWDDCSNGNVTLPSDHGNEATHQKWETTAIIIAVYIRKSWWAKDLHKLVSEDFVVHWYVQTKDSRPQFHADKEKKGHWHNLTHVIIRTRFKAKCGQKLTVNIGLLMRMSHITCLYLIMITVRTKISY